MMKKDNKGFTLIELMVVVAIIGVLAAVAIPNYKRYQIKTKETEAKLNLAAIAMGQESYYMEYDEYVQRASTVGPAVPSSQKQTWTNTQAALGGFAVIGWQPKDAKIYYRYVLAGVGSGYTVTASSDFDDDTVLGEWRVSDSQPVKKISDKNKF